MLEVWIYFMDEFTELPFDINMNHDTDISTLHASLTDIIKKAIAKYNIKVIDVNPFKVYKGKNGVLFEYTVQLENGHLSAKLMISSKPTELLYEYYNWERLLKI